MSKHWFYYRTIEVARWVRKLRTRVDLAGMILRSARTGEQAAHLLEAAGLGDLVEIGPPRRGCCGVSASGQRARLRGLLRGWKGIQPKVERAKELARRAEEAREKASLKLGVDTPHEERVAAADAAAGPIEEEIALLLDEIYNDLAQAGGARLVNENTGEVFLVSGGYATPMEAAE